MITVQPALLKACGVELGKIQWSLAFAEKRWFGAYTDRMRQRIIMWQRSETFAVSGVFVLTRWRVYADQQVYSEGRTHMEVGPGDVIVAELLWDWI